MRLTKRRRSSWDRSMSWLKKTTITVPESSRGWGTSSEFNQWETSGSSRAPTILTSSAARTIWASPIGNTQVWCIEWETAGTLRVHSKRAPSRSIVAWATAPLAPIRASLGTRPHPQSTIRQWERSPKTRRKRRRSRRLTTNLEIGLMVNSHSPLESWIQCKNLCLDAMTFSRQLRDNRRKKRKWIRTILLLMSSYPQTKVKKATRISSFIIIIEMFN